MKKLKNPSVLKKIWLIAKFKAKRPLTKPRVVHSWDPINKVHDHIAVKAKDSK